MSSSPGDCLDAILLTEQAGKDPVDPRHSSSVAITLPIEEPWVLAKERFLADLDDEERVLFNKATLENLYYSTSNLDREDRDRSKLRLTIQKLQPLVSAIES